MKGGGPINEDLIARLRAAEEEVGTQIEIAQNVICWEYLLINHKRLKNAAARVCGDAGSKIEEGACWSSG